MPVSASAIAGLTLLVLGESHMSFPDSLLNPLQDNLTAQGANATNSGADLIALQSEYDELGKELANIVKNTKYAGENLFSDGTNTDGTGGKFENAATFQIGASSSETLSFDVGTALGTLASALAAASSAYDDGTAGTEIASTDDPDTATNATAGATITLLETALDEVGAMRAQFGANINRLNHTINNLANMKDNTETATGRIKDADIAKESAAMTKNSMLMQSGIAMLKQTGQMPGLVMSLLG
jgi:flagellin